MSPSEAQVFKTIHTHHGATLSGSTWGCICGEKFPLPEQNGLAFPTQDDIIREWGKHLTERIVRLYRRRR